jgi:hypothetical protein
MTEDEAWQELERKQLNKNKIENEMKNKDLLFSHWYDSLEGTKSQGFAYKAWCAGWEAAVLAEREACAKLCEEQLTEPKLVGWNGFEYYMTQCAARIRGRTE